MTVVDIHGHLGTWHDFFIPEPSAAWLVATNTRIGIDMVGVSHLTAIGYDTAVGNRMALAAAAHHPGRLGVWLVANPHRRDRAVLADQLAEPGVWGLKLHPDVHEHPITGRGYEPYLELAREHGIPVLSHGQTRSPWSDPGLLADVSSRYDDLVLLAGHAGLWADGFERAAHLAAEHAGLYLEVCGSRLTTGWLERIVAIAGPGKVLFGTDACFLDPRLGLGKVRYARLGEGDREAVLGGNALAILRHRLPGAR